MPNMVQILAPAMGDAMPNIVQSGGKCEARLLLPPDALEHLANVPFTPISPTTRAADTQNPQWGKKWGKNQQLKKR
jgi:hypothetical protein